MFLVTVIMSAREEELSYDSDNENGVDELDDDDADEVGFWDFAEMLFSWRTLELKYEIRYLVLLIQYMTT